MVNLEAALRAPQVVRAQVSAAHQHCCCSERVSRLCREASACSSSDAEGGNRCVLLRGERAV